MVGLYFYSRLIFGWHHVCDAVLNIKHGVMGLRQPLPLYKFYIDWVLFRLAYQDILFKKYRSVFTISLYSMPVKVQARLYKFRAQHLITHLQDARLATVKSSSIYLFHFNIVPILSDYLFTCCSKGCHHSPNPCLRKHPFLRALRR